MSAPERFDVVIVGSGAGGAPVAQVLAQAGVRVLVLEKGPRHGVQDFLHDEISICRRNFWVPPLEDDPHVVAREDGSITQTTAGWIAQCVGGGTVHMSGFFFRLHPNDFRLASAYGPMDGSTAIDWPFGYETLAPYYERVEREVGVSGDVSKNPFAPPRSGPFPYLPVVNHPFASHIDKVGAELGLHPFPTPRAIITQGDGHDRGACVYCSLCGSYGCEVNAKSSTLASLIPKAEATGNCVVKPGCMVKRVLMRTDGRASGVEYVDDTGVHTVEADVVVVAATAIESARLLLLSTSQGHPAGLGNRHGQVGQNLCLSTLGQVTGFLQYDRFSPEMQEVLRNSAPFLGRALQDRYEAPGVGIGKGGTFHLLWSHPNPIHAAEQLTRDGGRLVYGEELTRRLSHRFRDGRELEVECFSEWLPTPDCHVTLDPDATDRFGLPAARITVGRRHPSDKAGSQVLVDEGARLLGALGATEITTHSVGGETWVLQHGTCRMGTDPRTSVTTPQGNLHDVENVYVTCGGALPSSGGVPSTFTIMANAFRVADGLLARLKKT
ncbi:MAG: GMC family oxidoreductase [Deltaproteobacteria bacterium]|nr:GMC family oxidoreductase [Deltaproteobacteria bacterium]